MKDYKKTYPDLHSELASKVKNWDEQNQEGWMLWALDEMESHLADGSDPVCEIGRFKSVSGNPEILTYLDKEPLINDEPAEIYTGTEMAVCEWCCSQEWPIGQFWSSEATASTLCEVCGDEVHPGEQICTVMSDGRIK